MANTTTITGNLTREPEIRYTRWGAQHFFDVNGLLHSNVNQGEFLLGITF